MDEGDLDLEFYSDFFNNDDTLSTVSLPGSSKFKVSPWFLLLSFKLSKN